MLNAKDIEMLAMLAGMYEDVRVHEEPCCVHASWRLKTIDLGG